MPAYNIKGITVEIGGDTKNFNTALDELNRKVNSSATEIGKLNRLLKGCPGLDMAGYVMHRTYTTVRPGIFKRARRQYMRAGADLKRSHFIPLYRSYRLISYNGYFKGTKSRAAAEALNQQKLFKSAKWAVRAAAIKERSLAV